MQVNLFPSVLYCSSKKHPSGIEWLTCRQIKRQGLKFGLIFDPEVPLEVKNTSVIEWLTQVKRQVLEFGLIFDQEIPLMVQETFCQAAIFLILFVLFSKRLD